MSPRRGRSRVLITRGFEGDVRRISRFFESVGHPARVDEFLEDLEDRVIPLLARTPQLGSVLPTEHLPPEGTLFLEELRRRLKGREARALVRLEFVLLYLVGGDRVWLVSVRHQREARFRFGRS